MIKYEMKEADVDPVVRNNIEVTGGSGSHRKDTSSTWAFSDSPILQLLDYCIKYYSINLC